MSKYLIGIDPGVTTGVAVWQKNKRELESVFSCSIVEAFDFIIDMIETDHDVFIRFEDARLRKWFGSADRERLQGAGSIKRDCSIWEVFCEFHDIQYKAIPPQANSTKLKADQFKRITGWEGRTNEHQRDAAMLVYGG